MLDRTEGVTASFLKELLRRAAVLAADRLPAGEEEVPDAVRVSADDLVTALDDLLDTRNRMTRRALGLTLGLTGAEDGAEPAADKSAVGEQGPVRPGLAPSGG